MNSGATTERVYEALKARILSREFRPGDRLEPAALSATLASSVTPVRDALNMLSGEGLVEAHLGEGFRMPQLTEPDLSDLYQWNAQVLLVASRSWRADVDHPLPPPRDGFGPEMIAELFATIASRSTNAEHAKAIASLNDRLHIARLAEDRVLDDRAKEIDPLRAAAQSTDLPALRRLISAYHRRRRRAAADIVRTIYRGE